MIKINIHKKLHGTAGEMPLNINLCIKEGEFIALTGVSGSGKTTLLRILAGLESVDEGSIIVGNQTWSDSKNSQAFMPIQKETSVTSFKTMLFFLI